jgi:hypothetical protein
MAARWEEDTMHPMFVELFLSADAEEELAAEEEDRRRNASRARRARLAARTTTAQPAH